ncbi:MAG: transcription termination/antitermination protein NusA [Francisellaceae bacterium]|jgi:transcription termination/antitermination protein NusA|nr:transcription termination/antitermination protein NusA [Francisellaceae bacterium]MBT6206800.1 transcription termination/antitermination protein NusA [Francisellaceae bacterium]MBT6539506.1 transcription termination/antitermination protein NusA [Francisellaceae bacterium]
MSKEIPLKLIVGAVSDEKGLSQEVILEALEAALISATKKKYGSEIDIRIDIDVTTGHYDTFRVWTVIDQVKGEPLENPWTEISLEAAQLEDENIQEGGVVEEQLESIEFGRIAAQTAKQVIIQKVREAERALIAKNYEERVGELIIATVKRSTRDNIILDLGNNAEGLLRKSDILPREAYRPGDRVRAYLMEVVPDAKGPQLMFSRTCPEMLVELFKIEVPEVGEGVIRVKGAARDPGNRAKIAVKTNDNRLDPVGACVGMRGARVQSISNELSGERIDIILWDEDPAQYVMNAIAPAELTSITVDDEAKTMDIAVMDEYLSQAIGRNGQNVRLASKLTGWELNVVADSEAQAKGDEESEEVLQLLTDKLDVESEVAEILVREGFSSLEEIAFVPIQEMLEIEEFDEDIVKMLRSRAKELVLEEAKAKENIEEASDGNKGVDVVDGVDEQMAAILTENKIVTRDELAELAVDDLVEIIDGLDEKKAADIIMSARAHWFSNETSNIG